MDMRQQFIDTALELINEQGTSTRVNLRAIARRIGCSHQNLYNYFPNYDALLWECMYPALQRLTGYTTQKLRNTEHPRQRARVFFSSQLEFAMQNPGIYSLIWLDSLEGAPSQQVVEKLGFASAQFQQYVQQLGGGPADIIHGYLHGSICKMLKKRVPVEQWQQYQEQVVENCLFLMTGGEQ